MLINTETIIKDTDELIRRRSEDVPLPVSEEDRETLMEMLKYVDESTIPEIAEEKKLQPAVGISAIQIGIPKKMTAIILKDEEGNKVVEYALVNPKMISNSIEKSYLDTGEGCLSVAEKHEGYVYRSARVKVKAYDLLQEKEIVIKADGYLAIVLQHELDHFKGVLFYDHINNADPFYQDPNAQIIE
ncbi:MAG: peptide deformylase [Erysipelotrichaceae bacterium]|nr:peptide deformylase [Erysipelotrichaceae bacterium]